MYASAGREHRELARILRELEGAPLEVRAAAARRMAAWSQEHAPTAVVESGAPSLSTRRVVVLFLAGGVDSWNLVVPHSGCDSTENGTAHYGTYAAMRGGVALEDARAERPDGRRDLHVVALGGHGLEERAAGK